MLVVVHGRPFCPSRAQYAPHSDSATNAPGAALREQTTVDCKVESRPFEAGHDTSWAQTAYSCGQPREIAADQG